MTFFRLLFLIFVIVGSVYADNADTHIKIQTTDFIYTEVSVPVHHSTSQQLAEELAIYLSRQHKLDMVPRLIIANEDAEPPQPDNTLQLFLPITDIQGFEWSTKYNLAPWLGTLGLSGSTQCFQNIIAVSRKDEYTSFDDFKNVRWCFSGQYPNLEYFATLLTLREHFSAHDITTRITRIHEHRNSMPQNEGRRTMLHKLLMRKADLVVINERDFQRYCDLYPNASRRLERLDFFDIQWKSPSSVIMARPVQFNELEPFRHALDSMHQDAQGEEFLIAGGLRRFISVNTDTFYAQTNVLKYFDSVTEYVWP